MSSQSLLRSTFIAGFAVFSMFFGSGNLVFPLVCGVESAHYFGYAALGLLVTGILVPLLGLISALVSSKPRTAFFAQLGPTAGFVVILLILSLIGPFGVCARCVLVAYGGFKLILPELPLWAFSLGFCIFNGLLLMRDQRAIATIGRLLTPLLLLGIVAVFLCSLNLTVPAEQSADTTVRSAFSQGFLMGYQTMDLMGALFFAFTIRDFFEQQHSDLNYYQMRAYKFRAALLGVTLLAIVYLILIYLGAKFRPLLESVPPERLIVRVSEIILGVYAKPVVASVVFLACLTTLIVLTKLSAEFLSEDLSKKKISFEHAVFFVSILTFFVSLIGFYQLSMWLAFVLELLYPALMAFAGFSLVAKYTNTNVVRGSFWVTLMASITVFLLSLHSS